MYNEQDLSLLGEFSEPRRLHPAAIYFNLVRVIKETILGLGVGLLFTLRESVFYFLIFASIFLVLLIVTSILSWFRFSYRVEENELRIEQGIFIRKKRYISLNRIHKIDFTANIVHRIFGLVKVQIDTASSGGGAEVSLSAIKMEEGARLRKALQQADVKEEEVQEAAPNYLTNKISWTRLFITGTTSGSVGFILVAMMAGFTQIEELIPKTIYNTTYTWIIAQSIVILIGLGILVLVLLWLLGIAGTMIRYGNFTIEKRENELFIKRGLLETKELTIPFDRIQAVGIEQSPIRQPIKFVRVFAIVAGGSFDKLEPFPVLFPLLHEKEVERFFQEFLPEYENVKMDFIPLAKKGLKYYLFLSSIWFIIGLIPILYFFPSFSWIPLLLIGISLAFGWLKFKDGGYAISGKQIALRRRGFSKLTVFSYHKRIQSLQKSQHKLQVIEQLANISISLIGSGGFGTHYSLKHLREEDANKIADWYSYRKKESLKKRDMFNKEE